MQELCESESGILKEDKETLRIGKAIATRKEHESVYFIQFYLLKSENMDNVSNNKWKIVFKKKKKKFGP